MSDDPVRFTYVGPAPGASLLAQRLEAEGLTVIYQRPSHTFERRDAGAALEIVRLVFEVAEGALVVGSVAQVVRKVANRYRDRFNVQGLPDEQDEGGSPRE